jgi:hypothetical protein
LRNGVVSLMLERFAVSQTGEVGGKGDFFSDISATFL